MVERIAGQAAAYIVIGEPQPQLARRSRSDGSAFAIPGVRSLSLMDSNLNVTQKAEEMRLERVAAAAFLNVGAGVSATSQTRSDSQL